MLNAPPRSCIRLTGAQPPSKLSGLKVLHSRSVPPVSKRATTDFSAASMNSTYAPSVVAASSTIPPLVGKPGGTRRRALANDALPVPPPPLVGAVITSWKLAVASATPVPLARTVTGYVPTAAVLVTEMVSVLAVTPVASDVGEKVADVFAGSPSCESVTAPVNGAVRVTASVTPALPGRTTLAVAADAVTPIAPVVEPAPPLAPPLVLPGVAVTVIVTPPYAS